MDIMGKKINRTGEEGYNNFGSKMMIKEYRCNKDIDVYFPEYDWTFKHVYYNNFKKGLIKCPYETRYFINQGLAHPLNPYIKGMMERNKFKLKDTLTPMSVAFYIAPLINAITRVGEIDER